MLNKTILCFVLLFSVSLAQLQCYNDENNDHCSKCLATEGCGFCGVIGQGSCVPGNASGSQLAQFNISECPNDFWKFGGASHCSDPVRIVTSNTTVNATTGEITKVKWDSLSVVGTEGNKASYDILEFAMETQGENGDRHIAFAVTYASGINGKTKTDAKIFAVVFQNIIEFVDLQDDGLDISDLQNDPTWVQALYKIDSFLPFQHTVKKIGDVNVFIGNVTTSDGKVTVLCFLGSGTWVYNNPVYTNQTITLDPYQMKCDLFVNHWNYLNHTSSTKRPTLGIQGFVASATVEVDLNTTESNNNRIQDGEVSFGGGIGFFRWDQKVSAINSEGVRGNYDVIVNDIPLPNDNNTWVPPGTVIKTTIFSIDNRGDILNKFLWDPKVGIDPVAANSNSTSGNSTTTGSAPSPSVSTSSTTMSSALENGSATLVANFLFLVIAIFALY